MDILAEARRRAFSLWLRTGRVPRWAKPKNPEVKFNPWHDADDGRFTFTGSGRYFGRGSGDAPVARMHERPPRRGRRSEPFGGFGGGGQGFTGGGASGSWETHADVVKRRRQELRAGVRPGKGWRDIEENGHTWTVDETGTARVIIGTIELGVTPPRSRTLQRRAGGGDRRTSDDGGHYVAPRFNAPTRPFNLLPQDMNLNRGRWRTLEDEWARDRRANRQVDYMIIPVFKGSSRRPSHINVWWWVDGEERSLRFPNERSEKSRDER
jgi:hypothetical protein